jgi:two-component system nitrate/nitrite response regulator NarL
MDKAINLVLVDDHQMVLEGLRALLAGHKAISVQGAFTNGVDALDFLDGNNVVDILFLDINLPGMNGFELCKLIKKKHPAVKIIALSTHTERSAITRMIQNGASGYLSKSADSKQLLAAIHAVYANSIYLGDEVQMELVSPGTTTLPKLTRREQEVLVLIAEGKTTAQIAEALFLSNLTIETHRRNIMLKFDVNNSASLIKLAVENGLI